MILLPVAVICLIGTAGVAQAKRAKKAANPRLQAERQMVYETALNTVKDPAKLRTLSAAFKEEGLLAEADMLEKRAALQELPEEVKAARREAFRKFMACTDPGKVYAGADAYEQMGCTGAAASLRKYAEGLTSAEHASTEDLPNEQA